MNRYFSPLRARLAAAALAAASLAQAQDVAKLVVGHCAGGPVDATARLFAPELAKQIGTQVLVENGPGASGVLAGDAVAKPPVYVLGNATAVWNRQISAMADLTVTCAQQSGALAYAMAGLCAKDVDVVQLYDAFTINTLLFLEDLGFCAKGEGDAFVENSAIAPGGRLAVNTNGGGLSCGHPGMYGIFATIEAVRQLRGEAGARQVPGAKIALAHGNGGTLSSQSTALLGSAEAL